MPDGYMGRLLFVDLTAGTIREEALDEQVRRDFLGGYGLGARILYERVPPAADPLGPDNMLGFVTGPLTGTPTLGSGRYTVVGKSPLTGAWADSNSGGDFGPYLKFAGFDAVFFTGISPEPVYLLIDNGKAELRDASDLWGSDTLATNDALRERHGQGQTRVACIGPAGEKMTLIAAVINDKGRAAGRTGLGAVMGSKKLKAVVARGDTQRVPIADQARAERLRKEWLPRINPSGQLLSDFGTAGLTDGLAEVGDSPVRNWSGSFPADFPHVERIAGEAVVAEQQRKYACWRCAMACGGHMKAAPGRLADSHKPEYETLCMAGANCLNDDLGSIIRLNDICNAQGLDTISMGAIIAFAIECYENEIITAEDTDGLELRWGDGEAIAALAAKIAAREGIGELLADGVKRAAATLGRGSEAFAVHSQGQELPAHDPKFAPALAVIYRMDAAPGRHTEGGAGWRMGDGFMTDTRASKFDAEGFGELHRRGMAIVHAVSSAGICLFAYGSYPIQFFTDFLEAVTGRRHTLDECVLIGERIATIRHLFNLREGLNPLDFDMNPRAIGEPPLEQGRHAGVTVDDMALVRAYLRYMDWDEETTMPSTRKLEALGLSGLVNG